MKTNFLSNNLMASKETKVDSPNRIETQVVFTSLKMSKVLVKVSNICLDRYWEISCKNKRNKDKTSGKGHWSDQRAAFV